MGQNPHGFRWALTLSQTLPGFLREGWEKLAWSPALLELTFAEAEAWASRGLVTVPNLRCARDEAPASPERPVQVGTLTSVFWRNAQLVTSCMSLHRRNIVRSMLLGTANYKGKGQREG